MQKCFYFICPTDCLEYTINKRFKKENYFYTSLDNSFVYDASKKHSIREIFFVLSLDNKIVAEAFNDNDFFYFGILNNFSKEIRKQKNTEI